MANSSHQGSFFSGARSLLRGEGNLVEGLFIVKVLHNNW
jgi:hypothetical protein